MDSVNSNATLVNNPLENIAIAFSGGGFRAASFALGTLSYLEHVKIDNEPALKHIRYLSSASGGTITNLLYTASLHKGDDFIDFYRHTLDIMSGEKILLEALSILNADAEWDENGTGKQRNLINAFAKVYDRRLFALDADKKPVPPEDATIGLYWKNKDTDLEVCFNATEFYRGLSFRFRTTGKLSDNGKIGNSYLYFDPKEYETVKKIKLADILAASSCFPAGFEPIVYPDDFCYPGLDREDLKKAMRYENYKLETHSLADKISSTIDSDPKQKSYIQSFSLMDGGITDNQGLNSMMAADNYRRKNGQPTFDLMLVTDVASYFMDNFEPPSIDVKTAWLKKNISYYIKKYQPWLENIPWIKWWTMVIGVVVLIICFKWELPKYPLMGCLFFSGVLITIGLALWVVSNTKSTGTMLKNLVRFNFLRWFTALIPLRKSFSNEIITKLTDYLQQTRLNILEQMLKARLFSVKTMVLDVNLKQVRRLIFNLFYEDERWENRRQSNFIYDLSLHNKESREHRIENESRLKWKVSDEEKHLLLNDLDRLYAIAERARRVGTTLWFEEKHNTKNTFLEDIVQTGQFTTCANLLEYLLSLRAKNIALSEDGLKRRDYLIKKLSDDFNNFKNTPDFLWKELDDRIIKL